MTQYAFILNAESADGTLTTERPIAKLGTFAHGKYGRFSITRRDYTSWARNLNTLQNGRIPIDYDHAPEQGGSTEAAGWITALTLIGGTALQARDPNRFSDVDPASEYALATIEWTPAGAEAVRQKRWLFVSPTFGDEYTDDEGAATGPYLHGVGLTNRPHLRKGMPAISLTADVQAFTLAEPSDTPGVTDLKLLRAALKLADTVSDDDVVAAAADKVAAQPAPEPTKPDVKTLAAQALEEGLIVLTAEEHEVLKASADNGDKAPHRPHGPEVRDGVRHLPERGAGRREVRNEDGLARHVRHRRGPRTAAAHEDQAVGRRHVRHHHG